MRDKRRMMAEINVVPYIDVMLVLLIIFMVTTPLITQGVKVDLPEAKSKPITTKEQKPVIVNLNPEGTLFLNDEKDPIDEESLIIKVVAARKLDPKQAVYIRSDKMVPYGMVIEVMAKLQMAGVESVGLLTKSPATPPAVGSHGRR